MAVLLVPQVSRHATHPKYAVVCLLLLCVLYQCTTGIYGPNPGLGKLLFAILFPVGLTMNTLHGTGGWVGSCGRGCRWWLRQDRARQQCCCRRNNAEALWPAAHVQQQEPALGLGQCAAAAPFCFQCPHMQQGHGSCLVTAHNTHCLFPVTLLTHASDPTFPACFNPKLPPTPTAELFTGNTMKLPAAIYEGKSTFGKLCHNWFWSYLGNFVGSLALVWLVVQSGVLANCTGYAIKTAMAKGTLPWAQVGLAQAGFFGGLFSGLSMPWKLQA